jgi:hypothetical protein
MRVTITIWADPQQIERLAKSGLLSPNQSARIWMSNVREVVEEAGFDLALETGAGFGAHGDWDVTIGNHTVRSRGRTTEPLDYQELAATLLGGCQCRGGPCGCSTHGREIVAGLLPVIMRNVESAVAYALERGAYAVDDASLRSLRQAEKEEDGSGERRERGDGVL